MWERSDVMRRCSHQTLLNFCFASFVLLAYNALVDTGATIYRTGALLWCSECVHCLPNVLAADCQAVVLPVAFV